MQRSARPDATTPVRAYVLARRRCMQSRIRLRGHDGRTVTRPDPRPTSRGLRFAHAHADKFRGRRLAVLGVAPPGNQRVAFRIVTGAAFLRNVVSDSAQPSHHARYAVAVIPEDIDRVTVL